MSRSLGDNLSVQDGAPPVRGPNQPPPARLKGMKLTRIIIEDHPDIPPTGLFLGWNGNSYMIQPAREVDAPSALLEILDNAVVTVPIVDTQTSRIIGYRSKLRFPYRIVRREAA